MNICKFAHIVNDMIEFNDGLDEILKKLRKKYNGNNQEFYVENKLFAIGSWEEYLDYRDSALLNEWLAFEHKNLVDEKDFYKRKIKQGFFPCFPLKNLIGFVWEV